MPKKPIIIGGKKHVVPIIPTKVVESILEVTTQPIKPARIQLRYPCIICYSFKHCALDCPR
jgi:hypothetical protein